MTGIHQLLIANPAAANSINITWPAAGLTDVVVVYGTSALSSSVPDVTNGALAITNTTGSDSAYAYLNSMPSAITDFDLTALSAKQAGGTGLQGLFLATSLQSSPTVLQNGYRFDNASGVLRMIEFNGGATTVHDSENLSALSPTYDYYIGGSLNVRFHMTRVGNVIEGWNSADGEPDTPHVTVTDSTHGAGRIGLVNFWNPAAANYWYSLVATWST